MIHTSLHLKIVGALIVGLCLSSCSRYSFSVNDNLIYTPPGLLRAEIADPGLRNCIQQHIQDQGIRTPEQLIQLSCSNAGIISLDGLDRFSRIEQLGLQDNQLTQITSLFLLANLEFIDLRGNPSVTCEELNRLKGLVNTESRFPQQCLAEIP